MNMCVVCASVCWACLRGVNDIMIQDISLGGGSASWFTVALRRTVKDITFQELELVLW